MEIMKGNRSNLEDYSFYDDDEDNDHEKTYVTVHADSFNEKDFNNFLNCLDQIHESENKRRNDGKVIKNYCVQVPYIDHSVVKDDDDLPSDGFDKTCNEMKNNISQMFSYFDEDVQLNYDDYDKLSCDEKRLSDVRSHPAGIASNSNSPENFREKFLRNRRKIKELGEASLVGTKPIIRGVIKKPNAPTTPNNSLNKNQVDKIMNEFNRVKINYYSKENYVEFTDIDYFYCDSDMESIRSEKVGKLREKVLSKFESQDVDDIGRKSPSSDTEIVPKNSVRDKIDMFSKLDVVILPCDGTLRKTSSVPIGFAKQHEKLQRAAPTGHMKHIIKNTSAANKNQNKCFIRDINNSLRYQVEKNDEAAENKNGDGQSSSMESDTNCQADLLHKIVSYAQLSDATLLLRLERIVNKFGMSLLHAIDGLMNDDAFTLFGSRMRHLNIETRPSIEQFNETFDGTKIDTTLQNMELSVVEASQIQLQMQVNVVNRATMETSDLKINVIFMAQYETDSFMVPMIGAVVEKDSFFIYFTSLFEVLVETDWGMIKVISMTRGYTFVIPFALLYLRNNLIFGKNTFNLPGIMTRKSSTLDPTIIFLTDVWKEVLNFYLSLRRNLIIGNFVDGSSEVNQAC